MKRSDVAEVLDRFSEAGIVVDAVQMAPLALLNFMDFDGQAAGDGATLLVDVGADKTDLVVSDGPRIWTRTLQLGGNNFTEALVKGFKLNFAKAEKLKRSAATSKYARQIFQAMRPVFAELVQEIQRSIGYYTSLHRESRFKRVVGLGNGFRLPGLQKFLEQNLNIPVVRVDSFNKLAPSPSINAPAFTENVPALAVAYGLALQGLDAAKIQTNLLPLEILRRRRWARKNGWFAGAAAMVLLTFGAVTWRALADRAALDVSVSENPKLAQVRGIVQSGEGLRRAFEEVRGQDQGQLAEILKYFDMAGYRAFWPTAQHVISDALAKVARHQPLMTWANVAQLKQIPRSQRELVVVEKLWSQYAPNAAEIKASDMESQYGGVRSTEGAPSPSPAPHVGPGAGPGGPGGFGVPGGPGGPGGLGPAPTGASGGTARPIPSGTRGYLLFMEGRTPCRDAVQFLDALRGAVVESAKPFPYMQVTLSAIIKIEPGRPSAAGGGGGSAAGVDRGPFDPLTGEDVGGDTRFVLGWLVIVSGDGLPKIATGSETPAGGDER